uniref:Uncharacterized protein n=1 Tax=Anopheles atroparvus TaxID=41427 RepID=A0A240PP30_ANOAO
MSDSDTTDSDCGVRYKTTTTRHKLSSASSPKPDRSSYRDSHSSSRHSDRRRHRRSRSKTPDRRRYRRRSRSAESSSRSRTQHRSSRSSRNVTPERATPGEKLLDISVSSVSSQDDHLEQHPQHRDEKRSSSECFGPSLPPTLTASKEQNDECDGDDHGNDSIGPALPPHLLARKPEVPAEPRSIGPSLPPGFNLTQVAPNDHAASDSELSPFSEPDEEDPDEAEVIGPLPGSSGSRANVELEQRALEMKIRRMEEATAAANGTAVSVVPKAREDWMLELPDIRKVSDMGLGARQFRTREKPEIGDRSVWTDTPADRERKKNTGEVVRSAKPVDPAEERERERERKLIEKRNKEQEKLAKQHKKKQKRDKTLLEIHQDKLKKEKKESNDGSRRPFNRDLDLQANRFDEAQKKAVMKKAQLLDTRFSSGSSKYL